MVYSAQLLDRFKENSNFEENTAARQLTDKLYEKKICACHYPILPLGRYIVDRNQSLIEKIQSQSIPILRYIGNGLAFYGLCYHSPLATTLGVLSLTFTAKKIGQALIGLAICPAALSGLYIKYPKIIPNLFNYRVERQQAHALITGLYDGNITDGCTITNIKIVKNGTEYDTYFIMWPEKPRAWVVHALDGIQVPGSPLIDYPLDYSVIMDQKHAFNHAIIAGPSVGHSTGWPDDTSIGEGYSAAIQMLEQIGVTHIVMEARGIFGGLTLAKAVETHDFKSAVSKYKMRYFAISINTADSLADAIQHTRMGSVAESIVKLCGMTIYSDKMNDRLLELGIQHVVIGHDDPQSSFDGFVHNEASLYRKLKEKKLSNVTVVSEVRKLSSYYSNYWEATKNSTVKKMLKQFLSNR